MQIVCFSLFKQETCNLHALYMQSACLNLYKGLLYSEESDSEELDESPADEDSC